MLSVFLVKSEERSGDWRYLHSSVHSNTSKYRLLLPLAFFPVVSFASTHTRVLFTVVQCLKVLPSITRLYQLLQWFTLDCFRPRDLNESKRALNLFQRCVVNSLKWSKCRQNALGRAEFCFCWVMANNGGEETLFKTRRGGKVQKSSFTSFEGWTSSDRMVGHKGVSNNLLLQFGH